MAKKKITDVVAELAGVFLTENGYELYNTEFVKEGRDWFLRVYIDKVQADQAADVQADQADQAGQADAESAGDEPANEQMSQYISTEDCEKVSRFLSEKLDEADPIEQNYYLEVSSPGMDRPLIRPEHYARYVGEEVEIRLYKAVDGVKNIQGVLESFDPESEALTVRCMDQGGQGKGNSKGKKGKGNSAEPDGKVYDLTLADIAKAKLAVIF